MRDIKVLHLEPTDVCQAACPLCARERDPNFRKYRQHHLDIDKITQIFSVDKIKELDKMIMSGNYGDPAAGKHTLDIYREFRKLNKDIVLGMNTNGGLQNTLWWHELGHILNRLEDYAVFSIDGLDSTNHIYRKNVNWTKLMTNAQAFIAAGGRAHWDMLVYRHNQHQIDACEQLARDMGFKWFRTKISKRALTDALERPVEWILPNVQSTKINCYVLQHKEIYIDAQGNLSPCAWLGSRQKDFITDFDAVKKSWSSEQPNSVCVSACGTVDNGSSFSNQWQRVVEL